MERSERIRAMEERMERARAALEGRGPSAVREDLEILRAYYTDGTWLSDYEADERGELPAGLKRGILSQDGLQDLLQSWNAVINEGEGL